MNIFNAQDVDQIIGRINQLTTETKGQWGKMTVDQMLAHLNVAYEMDHENIHTKPNAIARFFIKLLAKSQVVGPKPYPKNGRTAPDFIIKDKRDFDKERERLIAYLKKTQGIGAEAYHMRESHSFGKLTKEEWNTLFYKHLNHHLTQFGV